jgi:hypothetical protein
MGQFNPLIPWGTWLGLSFSLLPKESPFFPEASNLKKLPKGFFLIHFVYGRNFF